MTVEEMRRKKKELGYTNEMIAELAGVPLGTVQKIFAGVTENPRYDTLRALTDMFRSEENRIAEVKALYIAKPKGEYTIEDYYALPEDRREELIDGVLYDMAAPTSIHQILVTRLWSIFDSHIRSDKGTCRAMMSPLDVQLDCDNRTMVQPDVMVICDEEKLQYQGIVGAPDLVVEIISRNSAKRDTVIKLHKYMEAGVREYWIVDPDRQKVIVYHFEEQDMPVIYGFDAKIPVRIFDRKCEVDFSAIYEEIRPLYKKRPKDL